MGHKLPAKGSVLYSQLLITSAVVSANAFNIVFVLQALLLETHQLAEALSILSIVFLLSILQMSARNDVVLLAKEKGLRTAIERTVATQGVFAFAAFAALFLLAPSLRGFLHFADAAPFRIIAFGAFTYTWNGMMQGILAADKKIERHAVSLVTESLCRIVFAFILFNDGYASTDTAVVMLASSTVAIAVNILYQQSKHRRLLLPNVAHIRPGDIGIAGALLVSCLCLGASLKMDMLWAKHILDADTAGTYGVMSYIAGILFLNSSGISRAAISFVKKENDGSMIVRSYSVIVAICLVSVLLFYAVGLPVLSILTDKAEGIRHGTLLILFAAITLYSLMHFSHQCLSVLHLNIHLLLSLLLVALQSAALVAFADSPETIAAVNVTVMGLFTLLFVTTLLRHEHRGRAYRATSHILHGHHASV